MRKIKFNSIGNCIEALGVLLAIIPLLINFIYINPNNEDRDKAIFELLFEGSDLPGSMSLFVSRLRFVRDGPLFKSLGSPEDFPEELLQYQLEYPDVSEEDIEKFGFSTIDQCFAFSVGPTKINDFQQYKLLQSDVTIEGDVLQNRIHSIRELCKYSIIKRNLEVAYRENNIVNLIVLFLSTIGVVLIALPKLFLFWDQDSPQ